MEKPSSPPAMADIFRFLAQSMRYPTAEWLNDHFWSVLLSFLDELQWHEEREALIGAKAGAADFLEDVQVEYTRLFINAIPHVAAAPYASVHSRGDGTLYGAIAEQTKKFYREKGFALVKENDLPDHIVYELEFSGLLAKDDPEGQKIFLTTLFTPWFEIFRGRVLEEAHHPYYKVVVNLIDFFTREEL
ncbi:MAG: molecular chaperone TorD family protein [Deltaproteobacteria bacterium]|nr:molecular chaperone TorD family protein [Deltaproteobacteria bacterium]